MKYKEELKPCPFCGGRAELVIDWTECAIVCSSCKASMYDFYVAIGEGMSRRQALNKAKEQAIQAWNRRIN